MGIQTRQPFHGITDTAPQAERLGVHITESGQLGVRQQTVIIEATEESGDVNVLLPSVAEAAGLIYSIRGRVSGAGVSATVNAAGDSSLSEVAVTDGSVALLYSDGLDWITLT
jgi:hypothetical protein